jgi:hypothetical protein
MGKNDDIRKYKELRKIAQSIIADEVDLLTGCRNICRNRPEDQIFDQDCFLVIRAFETDTDYVPAGNAIKRCDEDFLKEVYQEMDSYIDKVKPSITSACKDIVTLCDRKIAGY